jgi:hypothetical protein
MSAPIVPVSNYGSISTGSSAKKSVEFDAAVGTLVSIEDEVVWRIWIRDSAIAISNLNY